jgi:hypothetical protein
MSRLRWPVFFLRPSLGDLLLNASHAARIDLVRSEGEDGAERSVCLFELHGSAPINDTTAEVIDRLVREFRTSQEGGEAHA